MAQRLIRDFVSDLMRVVDLPDPVVEFGSMQVEADQDGDLRPLFAGRSYVGTDFREGPGVDRVEDLRALSFGDGEVGTALCLDTLEHCEDPPAACRELARVVGPEGVCVISSVMLFGIHGYPNDYFRFTPEGFRSLLRGFDSAWVAGIGNPGIPMQVVGVGANGRELDLALDRLPSLAAAQRTWDEASNRIRVGPLLVPPGDLARTVAGEVIRLGRERVRAVRPGR
jgi:SAM-dependent methyltransferase